MLLRRPVHARSVVVGGVVHHSTNARVFFFFQAEDGIRDTSVTGVQTCALPIYLDRSAIVSERHFAANSCRRFFSTAIVGAKWSKDVMESHHPRIQSKVFGVEIGRASCRERV